MGRLKWITIAQRLVPDILKAAGVPSELIPALTDAVIEAEQKIDGPPDARATYVREHADMAIASANANAGKQAIDPIRVLAVIDRGVRVAFDAVELVHDRTTEPNQLNQDAAPPSPRTAGPADEPDALDDEGEMDGSVDGTPDSEWNDAQDTPPSAPPPASEPVPPAPAPKAKAGHPESTKVAGKGKGKTSKKNAHKGR